jgi:hypothetical protein
MATITNSVEKFQKKAAYHLVRRSQANIATYLHFGTGDLEKYLERDSFLILSKKLANHYFHRSKGLAIHEQVKDIYLAHLIMAPILQRLPLSFKYDWHRGHLLSWFRRGANGRIRRFHFASRIITRSYKPDDLYVGLEQLGIHDAVFSEFLLDIYRRHAGGTALKDHLAHQLFDPILLAGVKEGYELRFGNCLYRLEKSPFEGSSDLRISWEQVLEFEINSEEHQGGRHLDILLTDDTVAKFRSSIKGIFELSSTPQYKAKLIDNCIRDFVEHARWARSAKPQIEELQRWLRDKLRRLSGTRPECKHLGNLLLNLWLQRVDYQLYLKALNFFLNPKTISEKTYLTFFSPYREVQP